MKQRQKKFLNSAQNLLSIIEKKFKAPDWGFYDIVEQSKTELVFERKKSLEQNSIMAECLLKFHSIKKSEKLRSTQKIISNLRETAKNFGLNGAILSNIAFYYEKGVMRLELKGWNNKKTKAFLKKALMHDFGNTILKFLETKNNKNPIIQICKKNVCLKKVLTLQDFDLQ